MKSRRVVTRSSRKFCGYIPSKKLGRMVEWESVLERDAILLLEFSNGIKTYQEQPELVIYEHDGQMRRYFPDFSITLSNDEVVHLEVKPASKLTSLDLLNKFDAIARHYDRIGRNFRILTDDYIRDEPRLTNLKRFASVQHHKGDLQVVQLKVINLLKDGSIFTVQSLSKIYGFTNVLVLLARGTICCNMNVELLSVINFLRLPGGDDYEALYV